MSKRQINDISITVAGHALPEIRDLLQVQANKMEEAMTVLGLSREEGHTWWPRVDEFRRIAQQIDTHIKESPVVP